MRKLVLFIIAIMMIGSSVAQKAGFKDAKPFELKPKFLKEHIEKAIPGKQDIPVVSKMTRSGYSDDISKVLLGSSRNIYGGLLSSQTCLTYNHELNTIMFTCRGNDKGNLVPFGTGNEIITHTSSDYGLTFVKKLTFSNGSQPRYPSGVFYNPVGNSDTSNAYKLVVGPLNVNDDWARSYHYSCKYDGTHSNLVQINTDNTFKQIMRNGLTACSDNKFHYSGIGIVLNAGQTAIMNSRLFTQTGTWNTTDNRVDWETTTEIETNVVEKPADQSYYIDGSLTQEAWSTDGSIGYLMTLGADNRPADKPTFVPMVWKSTNAGTSWTMLPYFDWGTLPAIRDNIFPTKADTTIYKPYFEEASIVVDANNKPHIFGLVRGGWSAHLDSLNYIYVRASTGTIMDGNIVELYLDDTDTWQGNWVDSISADRMTEEKSPYYSDDGNVTWDHRVSASVTQDGSKVFCTWTDSDWIFWGTEPYIFNPDLKGWGRDVFTNLSTDIRNFTAETELWGMAFFNFTSRNTITTSPGNYAIPLTVTDINTSGLNADEPVYHYYVNGCTFKDEEFVGLRSDRLARNERITPVYPNPFKGTTRIKVVVEQSGEVKIRIFDITGKEVGATNYGRLGKGEHLLTIDGTTLKSGIYFCNINIGEKGFTQKMVVK